MSDNDRIAAIIGAKAWLVKRGVYTWVLLQLPGEREPWLGSRDDPPGRYTEIAPGEHDRQRHIFDTYLRHLPDFLGSMDACVTWLVPYCTASFDGICLEQTLRSDLTWRASIGDRLWREGYATPSEAFCAAFLAAFGGAK